MVNVDTHRVDNFLPYQALNSLMDKLIYPLFSELVTSEHQANFLSRNIETRGRRAKPAQIFSLSYKRDSSGLDLERFPFELSLMTHIGAIDKSNSAHARARFSPNHRSALEELGICSEAFPADPVFSEDPFWSFAPTTPKKDEPSYKTTDNKEITITVSFGGSTPSISVERFRSKLFGLNTYTSLRAVEGIALKNEIDEKGNFTLTIEYQTATELEYIAKLKQPELGRLAF